MADYLDEERKTAHQHVVDQLRTLAEQAGAPEAADVIMESIDELVVAERAIASAEGSQSGYLEAQMNFSTEGP